MKKCSVCGFLLPEVAKYCYSCGSKLSKDVNNCNGSVNDKAQGLRKKESSQTTSKRKKSSSVATSPKKRWKFVVLGILFGFLGLHLAYAKRWILFLLLWAGLICGNVMNEKKTTEGAPDAPTAAQEQNQEVSPERGAQESEKKSSNPISNVGFAVWGLLWIGGTLFIKKDGNGCRM